MMLNKGLGLWVMLVLLCGAAACSDDDDDDDNGTVMGDGTIVDVASSNDDFSTLVDAVVRADLASTLSGAGPFTVFAPTNAAFTASGITDVNAVDVAELRQILLYHVIPAEVPASAVQAGPVDSAAELTFFLGTDSGVTINGGNSVTGGANVTTTDIGAENGVIHAIDRVLLPPDIPTAATYGGLTELVSAVGSAAALESGMTVAAALAADGALTVFAPTNEAFGRAPADLTAEALRDVLLLHVVDEGSAVLSTGIPATAESLSGETLTFDTAVTPPTVAGPGGATGDDGSADIITVDIRATNGVVHVIDEVLLPAP